MCKFANDWADAKEETDKMYNDIPGFEGTLDALDDLTDFS